MTSANYFIFGRKVVKLNVITLLSITCDHAPIEIPNITTILNIFIIENFQVDNVTATSSDHSDIKTTLRVRASLKKQKLKKDELVQV